MFNELIKIVRQGDPKVLELEGMGISMPFNKNKELTYRNQGKLQIQLLVH